MVGAVTEAWVKQSTNREISKFEILDCWIVRQLRHEYSPMHFHSGHVSGVGYLMRPGNFGPTVKRSRKFSRNGQVQFIVGQKAFLSNPTMTFEPQIGDFFLFPHYKIHIVYFFNSESERRSLSFNARVDDNSYIIIPNFYNGILMSWRSSRRPLFPATHTLIENKSSPSFRQRRERPSPDISSNSRTTSTSRCLKPRWKLRAWLIELVIYFYCQTYLWNNGL